MEKNLLEFQELREFPLNTDISRLDEGNGIAETLKNHQAKWHKNCRNKFSDLKVQRARKRKSEETNDLPREKKFTRKSCGEPLSILIRIAFSVVMVKEHFTLPPT